MDLGHGKFSQDIQSIRSSLVHLDSLVINPRYNAYAKSSKALTMVWLCAVLEDFWKNYLSELCSRVRAAPYTRRRRSAVALSVFYYDRIGGVSDGKALRRWEKVADLMSDLGGAGAVLPLFKIPYDGRTVRPDHLDIAWRLFGLPGDVFPSPVHKQELNTLADRRNDVAHGALTPESIGGTVSVGDLRRIVSRLEEIVEHCVVSATVKWP
jgi:hypothetical protein